MRLLFLFLFLSTTVSAATTFKPTSTRTATPTATITSTWTDSPTPKVSATATRTVTPTPTPTATPSKTQIISNGFENPQFVIGTQVIFKNYFLVAFADDGGKVAGYNYLTGAYLIDLSKNNIKIWVPRAQVSLLLVLKP